MIRCPQCGTDNLDGSEYCDECGYQLSALRNAPTSNTTPQGESSPAPLLITPPVAAISHDQSSHGAAASASGLRPPEIAPGVQPADFSPPPPNVPSVAIPPQPQPGTPATPPAADVFAVKSPLLSAGASAPASRIPLSPPSALPLAPPASAMPPSAMPQPAEHAPSPLPAVPATNSADNLPRTNRPVPASVTPSASPSVPRAKLVIQRGGTVGKEFLLTETESNIGRWDADGGIFPDVDLDQDDPEAKVSRRHARIVYQDGQYILEDLGSTNGTFVNRGRRLLPGNRHPLNDGDEIIVGKTFLKFHYIR
ncbi:MAG: FHA domain-containing protein [Acidobacteriota bacterium]